MRYQHPGESSPWRRTDESYLLPYQNHEESRTTRDANTVVTPYIPRLIDDDISSTGRWYLADTANIHPLDPRADALRLWGLALWDHAKADATLFECVALLTLQKKRTIATTFDRIRFLDHKQRVYESLSRTVESSEINNPGTTALVMTLLSFVEVLEGKFGNAQCHVKAVAAMDFIRNLDEVQWRLIIWNDLRYSMKLVVQPLLCYYVPVFLKDALANIEGNVLAHARRLALGNWKHLVKCSALDGNLWYLFLVSLHTITLLAGSSVFVTSETRLAYAYEAEYRVHTIAARLFVEPECNASASVVKLVIVACQLHLLAVTSNFAPSTVECREILLDRAQSTLANVNIRKDLQNSSSLAAPVIWALSTFACHSIDGGFKGRQFFYQRLGSALDAKRVQSKSAFKQILRAWPWTDNWHTSRVSAVWDEVLVGRGRRWRCINTNEFPHNCVRTKSEKFYAGVFMFYES